MGQLPKKSQTFYSIDDLLSLMVRLRNRDNGCPWDVKQNFKSLVPATIEEAYEVAEAIETEDFEHLPEELGDLLFQVIFYAQLGAEQQRFDFAHIVNTLVDKLVRRHPHVFPNGQLYAKPSAVEQNQTPPPSLSEVQVKQNWETIKAAERNAKGEKRVLDGVAQGLAATTRAEKLQRRAARVGFDWPGVDGVLAKLEEELAELRQAIAMNDREHTQEELGDLLFSCVNIARHLQIDPESALRQCNRKFEQRFGNLEQKLTAAGKSFADTNLEELDKLWHEVKGKEKPFSSTDRAAKDLSI